MVEINLYPWRNELRQYQETVTKRLCWSALFLAMLCSGGIEGWLWRQGSLANERIMHIHDEISQYAQYEAHLHAGSNQLSIAELNERMGRLAQTAQFLSLLHSEPDADLCFSTITRKDNVILFSGQSRSHADLNKFLHQWMAATLFTDIHIDEITEHEDGSLHFRFQGTENAV